MKLTVLKKFDPFILLTGETGQLSIMRRDLKPAMVPPVPEETDDDAPPPWSRGGEAKGLIPDADPRDILRSQRGLLLKIKSEAGFSDGTFRDIIIPVLERAASCTGLLPASGSLHHTGPGGLFRLPYREDPPRLCLQPDAGSRGESRGAEKVHRRWHDRLAC